MAITPVNADTPQNAPTNNESAFDAAVENAKLNEQLVDGAISAFAPMLLMQRAGEVLREAQSED